MLALTAIASLSFSGAPVHTRSVAVRSSPTMVSLESLPGKYALGGVFDPLGLGTKGDPIWLREAELKHGRVAMLAVVGYIATDNGLHFPVPMFDGLTSLQAHDACVANGAMRGLAAVVGACELLDCIRIFPAMSAGWPSDYQIGSYALDPLKMSNPRTQLAEIKNGRLAMFAISGILTQSALGHGFPYTA